MPRRWSTCLILLLHSLEGINVNGFHIFGRISLKQGRPTRSPRGQKADIIGGYRRFLATLALPPGGAPLSTRPRLTVLATSRGPPGGPPRGPPRGGQAGLIWRYKSGWWLLPGKWRFIPRGIPTRLIGAGRRGRASGKGGYNTWGPWWSPRTRGSRSSGSWGCSRVGVRHEKQKRGSKTAEKQTPTISINFNFSSVL